ncbi:MAG: capsule assembly Wzi family protein [Bacteroidales bacterium]|nr:capsule assembly Wzi family protein [Bacteroidales bacterium]
MKVFIKKQYFLIFLINTVYLAQGQILRVDGGGIYSSSSHTPYFISANRTGFLGTMHKGSYASVLACSIDSIENDNKIRFIYGIEPLSRIYSKTNIELFQAYGGLSYKFFRLWAGKRKEFYGNQDTILSSGGTVWSGNAPPIPKIMFATNNFINIFNIPWFSVNSGIAHGWLGYKESYIRNPFLHQKYFYVRLGNPQKIFFTAGIQHYAQWGGISPIYGQLPNDFKNFLKVFFAYNNEDKLDPTHSGMPENEARNRIGNHVGTKDFGLDLNYRNWKVKLYWQNFIEDITGLGFRNAMDGLWGITINRSNRLKVNYEFVHTYTYYVTHENRTLLDDYFNNTVYRSGWTYKGYVIGTPLITSPVLLADSLIGRKLPNNRVIAHHLASSIYLKKVSIILQYIYSKNYGNSDIILIKPKIQNYLMVETYFTDILPRLSLKTTLAYDYGDFLTNKWGINICFSYRVENLF